MCEPISAGLAVAGMWTDNQASELRHAAKVADYRARLEAQRVGNLQAREDREATHLGFISESNIADDLVASQTFEASLMAAAKLGEIEARGATAGGVSVSNTYRDTTRHAYALKERANTSAYYNRGIVAANINAASLASYRKEAAIRYKHLPGAAPIDTRGIETAGSFIKHLGGAIQSNASMKSSGQYSSTGGYAFS
jgi:hypothetical protein